MNNQNAQIEPYDEVSFLPLNEEDDEVTKDESGLLKLMNLPSKKETKVVWREFKLSIIAASLYAILSLPFLNNLLEKLTSNFYQQLVMKIVLFSVLFYILQTYFKLY